MDTPQKNHTLYPKSTNLHELKNKFKTRLITLAISLTLLASSGFSHQILAQKSKIDSLLKTFERTKVDTSRVRLLHEISIEYIYNDLLTLCLSWPYLKS